MEIKDMPKLYSPFVRREVNGRYVVVPEINLGYEWVFEDDSVLAIEKLHGTCVSVVVENGKIKSIWNRKEHIAFFNKGKMWIIEGVIESFKKGYFDKLGDGQHFGELIEPNVSSILGNKNVYNLDKYIWIPFSTYARNSLKYKSWGRYPKDFETISNWFKVLMPLFNLKKGNKDGFVEGVVFTHPDGRMAKLRRDMFSWFKGEEHKKSLK